ncbi:MAG TPA: biotin transporter BioY, partial [Pseudothermotoga sp.]|nr:biotin transporter BioY [Pseudothermotoga sp.]HOK83595.1 biotin transporter BioY [Pseudothermotoga sp.]
VVLRLAIANFGLIYGFGLIQLYLWFAGKGVYISLSKLLSMGLIPFVSGDLIKILLAYSTYSLFRKISE